MSLRAQAALQMRQEVSADPLFEIVDPAAFGALPEPDPGDVFLDFEGDPLFDPTTPEWGLEYLCGTVTPDETYRPFWAHSRAAERVALCEFLDFVAARRRDHPNMHVYHYAPYEKSALLRLAGRHGVGEEAVDGLLREHVLVDLYPIVRAGLRVGQRSYGLKSIEPLYLASRTGDVTGAAESIVAYGNYCDLRDAGRGRVGSRDPHPDRRLQPRGLPVDTAAAGLAAGCGPTNSASPGGAPPQRRASSRNRNRSRPDFVPTPTPPTTAPPTRPPPR